MGKSIKKVQTNVDVMNAIEARLEESQGRRLDRLSTKLPSAARAFGHLTRVLSSARWEGMPTTLPNARQFFAHIEERFSAKPPAVLQSFRVEVKRRRTLMRSSQ